MQSNEGLKILQNQHKLAEYGHAQVEVYLDEVIKDYIKYEDFESLDKHFQSLTEPDGRMFELLKDYCNFESIEFIISLRDSENEWEEDGIWHDDGSRKLAFSLSLTQNMPMGGVLEFREKGRELSTYILTPDYGNMIIFKTGFENFEHKINAVKKGSRLVIAGWCT